MWVLHLALPLLGLWLLISTPATDLHWEHHGAHFALVLATAAVSCLLAALMGIAAARRGDTRLLLVALAFGSAAALLGVHALATPGVVVGTRTVAFTHATSLGLALGAAFAL